jgi:peptide/nickel transport system substrate-binding protein
VRWSTLLFALCLSLVVACGGGTDSDNGTRSQSGSPDTSTAGAATTPAAAAVSQPRGELRIGADFLPANLDPTKAFNLQRFGVGETLTRLTTDLKPEPWLAREVKNVDPTTWRVSLRPNATFHDGSPVDAEAVAASFRRVWENNATATGLISKDSQVTVVDPATLEFKTPNPEGAFPNNLAAFQFIVHKATADGVVMTGPYRPVRLVPDESLQLEAFTGYWGGVPPIARIEVKGIRDTNARVLALQSGDIDLLVGLPLEMAGSLGSQFERPVIPGLRMQYMILNHGKPVFADRAVREAISLGIDRETLNKVGFDGRSKPAVSIFPSVAGLEVVQAQTTDTARSRQILDQAGWTAGADGVRGKGGQRLRFTLLTYPQRADLTPMAVSIQSQLKALGIEVEIQQVQDIGKALEGDFDAAMYSLGMLPTGDPYYAIHTTLATRGQFNFGRYSNAQVDALAAQLQAEPDPAKRQALSRQVQEVIKADVPNLYLVASPLAYAYNKSKVRNLTLHPSDLYLIDGKLAVQ